MRLNDVQRFNYILSITNMPNYIITFTDLSIRVVLKNTLLHL